MIPLFIWLGLLIISGLFGFYSSKGELFFHQMRNRAFPILVLLFGILHIFGVINVSDFYFLNNSFKSIDLTNQVSQCFVLMPFLIIFLQIYRDPREEAMVEASYASGVKGGAYYSDYTMLLLAAGVIAAMSTYNLNIIFAVFVIFELFSIEKGEGALKRFRRELIVLQLVIFPFALSSEKIFPEIFFSLLIILNVLDVYSFNRNQDKKKESDLLFQNMILTFPLRMTILSYYASSNLSMEYLKWGKTFFLFLILVSCFYGVISRFALKSQLVIAQVLFLASTLSGLRYSYMEFYFLLNLLTMHGIDALYEKKGIQWLLIGPILIILLSLIDGPPGFTGMLSSAFVGDNYSKMIGFSLLLFFTMLAFRWGQSLRGVKRIIVNSKEKYYILALVICVVFNARYNTSSDLIKVDWASKIIVLFYFIIVLLASYVINIPIVNLKKINKYSMAGQKIIGNKGDGYLPFEIIEGALRLSLNKLLAIMFFAQEVISNLFFVLVDTYEHKGIKKYQHLAMFLLMTFLFLWIKVFMSNK